MTPKLSRRLGRAKFALREEMTREESVRFVRDSLDAEVFEDLPQWVQDLVLRAEGRESVDAG